MKPLYLEMTAFGSYAEKTCLPFEQLRRGLYLVAGDTGAGKTTIFDAVVFALFGKASGRDRSPAMLHSDYVDKSTDTVVTLRFEEGGKEYTVHRSIHFPKKRGGEGGFGDQQIDALLEEPDREPTEGAEKVTRRVEALLGLNAEQFRKIVMLAQGEFREFLKADSDKKNEILGKLFDNSAYLRYQNLLSGARDELARRRSARREELQQLMQNGFLLPEDLPKGAAEDFLPEHPALLDHLRSLIAAEEEKQRELARLQEEARRQISELDSRRGAAETLNAQFAAMESLQRELETLESRRKEMEERRAGLERAETAYSRLWPAMEGLRRAERALSLGRSELEQSRQEAKARELALEEARAAAQDDENKERRLRELELLGRQLEEQRRKLGELKKSREERDRALRETAESRKRLEALEHGIAEKEAELQLLRTRLESLEGAEALVLQWQSEWDNAEARDEALGELQRGCAAVQRERRELGGEEEKLSRLAGVALQAEEAYHRLYRSFLAGQAGLMAQGLREEIARRGEALCPVCGSRVSAAEEAAFAPGGEELPGQSLVDEAKKRLDRAERERGEQDKRVEADRARLQSRLDAALDRAGRLLEDCGSWEQLLDGRLERALAEEKEKKKAAKAALEDAKKQEEQRRELRQTLPGREQALEKARRDREALTASLQELRSRAETLEALCRERAEGLLVTDEEEAEAEEQRQRREQSELKLALERSRRRLEEARSLRDTALGGLREQEELLKTRQRERDEADTLLSRALEENGFADAREAENALPPAGQADPAAWLREERRQIGDWEAEGLHKRRQLERQRESLAGKEPVDTGALLARLQEANQLFSRCSEAWGRQENLLANHRQVLARAGEAKSALERSERAWKRLERLGSLAVGVNSESGRLSFDRYVMGAVFREILEMANRRMDTMSGGRYQLIHRSGADRRNARAGLEIQVLDLSTGQMRGSESLSGGEGFFTSLALALGLADVVQNRTGGRNLEALFIDEGFGSLSGGVLDKALDVLSQLSEGRRLVGIISHVEQLEESIPQKIRVTSGEKGSSLRVEPA